MAELGYEAFVLNTDNYDQQIYVLGVQEALHGSIAVSFTNIRDASYMGNEKALKVFEKYKQLSPSLASWRDAVFFVENIKR